MSDNTDVIVNSPEELYRILIIHGRKLDADQFGVLAFFYSGMKEFTNPNTCSCKKGEKKKRSLQTLYRSLPNTMTSEQKKNVYDLFGGSVVLMMEGEPFGRLE